MTFQTLNPATGKVVKTFSEISDGELEAKISAADRCFRTDWSRRPVAERCQLVAQAAELMEKDIERHAALMTLEMGKPIQQARAEMKIVISILAYYGKNGEAFLAPETLPDIEGAEVIKQPIGIILAIEPWNWPYYQVARVIGPQLVAGNVVMLKHAESVPQCALAIEEVLKQAGLPNGAYTNLFVSFDQVDHAIADSRIKGVTLTGSERAGSTVAALAGKSLKKVVLELGGSDPLIVLEDAPLDAAVVNAAFGRMLNTGQSCVASKRLIIVGKERGKAFLDGLVGELEKYQPGEPSDDETTFGALFSERALEGCDMTPVSHPGRTGVGG